MKIAVIGIGGIGGVLAANLSRAGHDVTPVVGNAAIREAIARDGLRVREVDGTEWSARPSRAPVLTIAEGSGDYDAILCVTQSTTLDAALKSALPVLSPKTIVVTCQNGLPEDRAAAIVGEARVLGSVVGWAASMVEPGVYQRTSSGVITLGRPFPASPDRARTEALARVLECASHVKVTDDLAAVRWSKLAINCVTTTLGAAGGSTLGPLLLRRHIRRLALEVFTEVASVAHAQGVTLVPIGGTLDIDRVAITQAERASPIGTASLLYKHSLLLAVGVKYRRLRSSMLYALERGRPPEIDFLNGEVVRRGDMLGVPVPVNRALVDAIGRIRRGEARSSVHELERVYRTSVNSLQ